MPSDFTVIEASAKHIGDDANSPNEPEFVGNNYEKDFDCPGVDSSEIAVLVFHSKNINTHRIVMEVNGQRVPNGLREGDKHWHAATLLVSANVLKESGNTLFVESRNSQGGRDGDIDDFWLDNISIFYKTAARTGVGVIRVRRDPVLLIPDEFGALALGPKVPSEVVEEWCRKYGETRVPALST